MADTYGPDSQLLWGLILAAGDGRRLQRYVQQCKGEELPKQYVNFVGQRSMLEHTFHRVERLIPPRQILTIIGRHHLAYSEVRRQLSSRSEQTIIVQPENKETGPGILLPLMFLYKRCPEATVALFPSDHFILEEDRFINHACLAAQAVRHDPTRIILLAIEAQRPETDYGYILPGDAIARSGGFGTRKVLGFVEKPEADLAVELMMAGGLWNTMTMVFKVKTLLALVRRVYPAVYLNFCRILEAIGTPDEQATIHDVYELLEPMNFSKGVLERIADGYPESVSVLSVRQVYWSDWGCGQRIMQDLRTLRQLEHQETMQKQEPAVVAEDR